MKLIIVTGMSGAGKTIALKMLEDMGYYCADNLPIPLIREFAELTRSSQKNIQYAALGIDIRSGEGLADLESILNEWDQTGMFYHILFLDAKDDTLIKRFKETRRSHPLSANGRINQGIEAERTKLGFLKGKADYIIDTSKLLTRELRGELDKIFIKKTRYHNLFVTVLSFGFKYGIPSDADLVFDVRFLPNPFYEINLRHNTGQDQLVKDFVMSNGNGEIFLKKLSDLLEFLIPNYILEGKNQLVIGIGCTGGKHRSVAIAESMGQIISNHSELGIKIEHRDIEK